MENFLNDTTKIQKVCNILYNNGKTLTKKQYTEIRKIVGIDEIKPGAFYAKYSLPIDLGLKASVARTISSLGATEYDLLVIFGTSTPNIRKLLNDPVTNIAIAIRNYFVLRIGRITDVRKSIEKNLGIKVKNKNNKIIYYTNDQMRKLINVLCTRLKITEKQAIKIFHVDIFGIGDDSTKDLMKMLLSTPAPAGIGASLKKIRVYA